MECPNCHHVFTIPRKKKTPKETDPRVTEIIQYYSNRFFNTYGTEPMIKWGASGTVVKGLLTRMEPEFIKTCINEYVSCDDKFFKETGYPFLLLPNYIQKKAVQKPKDSIPEWKKGPV